MATLRYDITATQPEFSAFADKLGYMTTVFTENGGLPIPNPESRDEFIARRMKEAVDTLFYTPYVADIERQVRDERDVEKEAMRNEIRNRSSVTFI